MLLLAGDMMTGRGIDQVQAHPGSPTPYESWVSDARDDVRLAEAVNGLIAASVAPGSLWGDALSNNHVLDWDRAGLLKTLPTLRGAGLQNAGAGADAAEAWALVPLRLQRFRLNTADGAAHDFVGQVFSAAAVGLGARPDRHRQTAWLLRAAAGS